MSDIFDTLDTFTSGDKTYRYYSLPKLAEQFEAVKRLPYCMKIVRLARPCAQPSHKWCHARGG